MSTRKQDVVLKKTTKNASKLIKDKNSDRDPSKDRSKKTNDPVDKKILKPSSQVRVPGLGKAIKSTPKPSPESTVTKTRTVNKNVSKKNIPNSPTSSRVSKSQFFPSKQMYANALNTNNTNETEHKPIISDRKKSLANNRTRLTQEKNSISDKSKSLLNQHKTNIGKSKQSAVNNVNKVKASDSNKSKLATDTQYKSPKNNEISSENSSTTSTLERPKTATLRKGSIVNANIAGPGIPKDSVKLIKNEIFEISDEKEKDDQDYDYEDDFDSYASDFEEYESSENTSLESTLHSNGEISSSSSSEDLLVLEESPSKRINSADEERKLDSGNFDMSESKHKQILDNINEIVEHHSSMASLSDEGFEEVKSLQFVNFLGAKQKRQKEEVKRKKNKRGDDLMSMIRLDQRNFTLFDVPPISYDKYIKSFGNRNTSQISSQTGEDFISEEIQTDSIETTNKWTQFPTKFSKVNETDNYINIYKSELLGSGNDEFDAKNMELEYNEHNLKQFLKSSTELILTLLQKHNHTHSKEIEIDERNLPFSKGYIPLNTTFLQNRTVTHISFSENVNVLTIHSPVIEVHGDIFDYYLKSIGCIWNLENPSEPADIFGVYGYISSACFNLENNKLIFGGMADGTVTLWDLSESPTNKNHVDIDLEKKCLLKSACFVTNIDYEHSNKIVSLYSYRDAITNEFKTADQNTVVSVQVITLDESGYLVIWGLIPNASPTNHNFSNISLVRNSIISLAALNPILRDLSCTDMCISLNDLNHIYITTNYGYILHCLASGTKANPKKFLSETGSSKHCIESCPYLPGYFLVGCNNGSISLYTRTVEKPLMTMHRQEGLEANIDIVQWSKNRPCIFYVKDSSNTIQIWDMAYSELFPSFSIPFAEQIKFFKLSPINKDNPRMRSYMAIVTNAESILLHILNKEHKQQDSTVYEADLKKFQNYVKRL